MKKSKERYEGFAKGLLKNYGADVTIDNIQDLRERLITEYDNGYQEGFDACGLQIRELLGHGV